MPTSGISQLYKEYGCLLRQLHYKFLKQLFALDTSNRKYDTYKSF